MKLTEIAAALGLIEDDGNLMENSVRLFWALFKKDSKPIKLGDDILRQFQSIRDRGEATPAEMSILAVHDPEFTERLPERLEEVTKRFTSRYEPDDPEALFVAAHLQASRLALYLMQSAAGRDDRLFGYGGDDVSSFAKELKTLIERFESAPKQSPIKSQSALFSVGLSLWAIESLWERVDAELAAWDGEYARALTGLEQAQRLVSVLNYARTSDIPPPNEELDDVTLSFPWLSASEYPWIPMWLSESELPAQTVVDWFEALKDGPDIHKQDWEAVATACDELSRLSDVPSRDSGNVVDREGRSWEWRAYWQRASGWAEAQLTPSDLLDHLEKQEDKWAEERLRAYFFDEAQWDALSKDAQAALISADRAWMHSRHKTLLVLDQLQVATEDVLYHNLWNPLLRWRDTGPRQGTSELDKARKDLRQDSKPGLRRYVKILGSDGGVADYLCERFAASDAQFVTHEAKSCFEVLLDARNKARHSTKPPSLNELRSIYAEFMGLWRDRLAVLPELVRILNQPQPPPLS